MLLDIAFDLEPINDGIKDRCLSNIMELSIGGTTGSILGIVEFCNVESEPFGEPGGDIPL